MTDATVIELIRVLRDTWLATTLWLDKPGTWHIQNAQWRCLCRAIAAVCNAVEIPRGELERELEASIARYVHEEEEGHE